MNSRFEVGVATMALAGLALFALSAAGNPHAGLQGWLAAAVAWAAVSLGCLIVTLMRVLVGKGVEGGYGPALGAASWAVWLVGLAFIPVLLGLAVLFPWATVPPEGNFQKLWLQSGFFIGRNVGYFLLWTVIAGLVPASGSRPLAVVGVIIVGVTGSMAALDWMISLQPHFHSSIYGMLFLSHAALVGWSFAAAATLFSGRPVAPQIAAGYIIAGVALWAYLSFCQYLVVWNGNQPDEIRWYLLREHHGWGALFWAASLLEGVVPLLFLMPGRVRASRAGVAAIALILVLGGMVEMAVFVLPSFGGDTRSGLSALSAAVGLGGLWLAMFGRRFRKLTATAAETGHA